MSSSPFQGRGGKKMRPLGLLRHTICADDQVQLSKFNKSLTKHHTDGNFDDSYAGIQGSALTAPSCKDLSSPGQNEREKSKSQPTATMDEKVHARPSSTSAVNMEVSHEACQQEIKEAHAREQDLRELLAQVQKEMAMATLELADKNEVVKSLRQDLQILEEDYKKRLQEEQSCHALTRQKGREEAVALLRKLEEQEQSTKQKLDGLHTALTKQMMEVQIIKDKEIADRDQKLSRLKMQMADALKGNSWERQQQLEELSKDLARVQEECDMLRGKLKTLTKNKQGDCPNCAQAAAQAEKLATSLKERDTTVKDLKAIVSKYEKQLSQQDQLLKLWSDSKGHKVVIPK